MAMDVSVQPRRGGDFQQRGGILWGPLFASVILLAILSMLLALVSMQVTREPGALAVLWLPNAIAIGWFWADRRRRALPVAVSVAVGTALAKLVYGDSLLVSCLLGAVNGVEVLLACSLIARLLRFETAHKDSSRYLVFLGAICMLPAVFAGLLAASVVTYFYGALWHDVFVAWVLGNFTCTLAVSPFVCLVLRSIGARRAPSFEDARRFLICLVCLLFAVSVFTKVATGVSPVIIAGPLLGIFALWLPVSAMVVMTAGLLFAVAFVAFSAPVLFGTTFGLAHSPSAFVLIFGCLVIPGNLIAVSVAAVRSAERQAQELSRLKSEFLATMSHEIRTPLNAILGMFQLLQRGGLPDKQAEWAQIGQVAGERLLKLLTDVLEMSRLEAKAVKLSHSEKRVDDLAAGWQSMAEAVILRSRKPLGLAVELDEALPQSLWIDEGRLNQVVQNLIENAIRFTDNGRITIGVSLAASNGRPGRRGLGETVEFWVSDTGCGIPPERLSQIFERFSQVDGSITRRVGGTGLGLAISSDLARLMGGGIVVDSVVNRGTTFRLRIPLSALQLSSATEPPLEMKKDAA